MELSELNINNRFENDETRTSALETRYSQLDRTVYDLQNKLREEINHREVLHEKFEGYVTETEDTLRRQAIIIEKLTDILEKVTHNMQALKALVYIGRQPF